MPLKPRADQSNSRNFTKLAFALDTTGKWDGNDGKWSTFFINVGDKKGDGKGQNFRVLISTSFSVTQVPLQSRWCNDDDCAFRRGIERFDTRQPHGLAITEDTSRYAWQQAGLFEFPAPSWWPDNMGVKVNGSWGLSNVGLGSSSPASIVQPNQNVVGTVAEELFMGTFGLETTKVATDGPAHDTYLTFLRNAKVIPSTSYGYTAGAFYKNGNRGILGSLVLGGYDASRKGDQGVEVSMGGKDHSLTVAVQSVEYHADSDDGSTRSSFTADGADTRGFFATIDSTLPYLWLPEGICDQFADKFRLTYDDDINFYTVNATSHEYNMDQNPTVKFKIGKDTRGDGKFASISMPYSAFYLDGSEPLFRDGTKYFPIRKAFTEKYVLGRAFLQETYLVVNYENSTFSVAPAFFTDPMPEPRIVSIFPHGEDPALLPSETTSSSRSGGLPPGAIAGIVVGVVVLLGLLALGAFFFFWRRHRQRRKIAEKGNDSQDFDTTVAGDQISKWRRVSELDSEPPRSPKHSVSGYYDAGGKSTTPFPPITELESPSAPAELHSPLPEGGTPSSERTDYFNGKPRRRGATREFSTGHNTPGTPGVAPIAELPDNEVRHTVHGEKQDSDAKSSQPLVQHSRSPSDAQIPSKIDEVMAGTQSKPASTDDKEDEHANTEGLELRQPPTERRPSHTRGLSNTTINSESTAVSEPTPEEREQWSREGPEPIRPLSQ